MTISTRHQVDPTRSRYATCIIRFPTGRFGLVGTVPYSMRGTYDTEQDVIDGLLALGLNRFQLDNCSWYDTTRAQDNVS